MLKVRQQPSFNLPDSNTKQEIRVLWFREPLINECFGASVVIKICQDNERYASRCAIPTRDRPAKIAVAAPSIRKANEVISTQVVEYATKHSLAQLVFNAEVYWDATHSNKSS